ncbi:MAG: TIGR02391 family protein [Candidatus Dormibacteria bacterium]
MSGTQMPSPPPVPLHPEIWRAAQPAWDQGLIEHAVFDAFKRVESLVQARIGSASIGNALVDQAFSSTAPPPRIDISTNTQDIERLVQVFKGSLGLFKGARSHGGQTPTIPAAADADFALRLLAWASVLVDLLDRDVLLAPAFLGHPQIHDTTLTIWAERVPHMVRVQIDGQDTPVTSRMGNSLEVSLDGISPGTHEAILEHDGHRSRPESFDLPATLPLGNWHRVLATSVPVFANEQCRTRREEKAILLESLEGGHRYRRVFPSASTAQAGEYVSWEWKPGAGLTESWVQIRNTTHYAWTGSMFFSGKGTPPTAADHVTRLTARPGRVSLRPGSLLPLRVLAEHTDGVGVWNEDVSGQMTLTSTDQSVAFIEGNNTIRAKKTGQCEVRVDGLGMHTEVPVVVAAYPRGTIVEYVGGIWNPRGLATRGDDLLIVENSETIWTTSDRKRLTPLTSVALAYLASSGLDQIVVSPSGNLAVRELSTRRFLFISTSDLSRSIPLELPDKNLTPMASAWNGEALLVADHTGGIWLFGDTSGIDESAVPHFLWKTPSNPTAACIDGDHLFLLTGGGGPGLYEIDMNSGTIVAELLGPNGPTSASAVALQGNRLWAADFYDGALWARENNSWQRMGDGLRNPAALALGSDGSVYIAEFGADAIARMLP